ncbi:CATRA system-associated protein [Actinomycetospora chiangmaiensis]|uniref:CATRA system-associated protein n=1 Tax=Actinomycetospora chiangmaiensis TaxID=402650 RepID=UPI0012F7A080|nr:CATRA system-associated protein [Actinomycetospora chiangmaiensis]
MSDDSARSETMWLDPAAQVELQALVGELDGVAAGPRRWASVEAALARTLAAARRGDREEFREGVADLAEATPHRATGIGREPVVEAPPTVRALVTDLASLLAAGPTVPPDTTKQPARHAN